MLLQALLRLSHGIDALTEWVGKLAYWLVLPMVLVGVWNVVGRYVGYYIAGRNLTSNGLIELQWYIFSMVFLLGAAYTLKHNGHVRVDVLYSTFSWKRKALVNVLGTLFFLIPFCIIVMYFSWPWVLSSWKIFETSNDPGGLPRYPIKAMILVGFGLLLIQGISEFIKNLALLTGQLEPQGE